jgi:hypothetical protein
VGWRRQDRGAVRSTRHRLGHTVGHGDRGECTHYHNVVSASGTPLPKITALSAMPHEFRGVCNNCHQLEVPKVSWLVGLLDRLFE